MRAPAGLSETTSADDTPDLSVVIVSYNSANWLGPCISSVYEHAGRATVEVTVVDNGSTDGSRELLAREFPAVRVVMSENRGFAYANNRGFEASSAPFVLFLNPDTVIRDGTFGDLLEIMRARLRLGMLGCRQYDSEGLLFPTIKRFPTVTRQFFEALGAERFPIRAPWMGERELNLSIYDGEVACDWVSGSFMLARREALLECGLMDERYFLYCEEPDLCVRLRKMNWEVRYVPDMTIIHYFWKNSVNERLVAQEAYARRQYLFKHQGRIRRLLSTGSLALFHARRAVRSPGQGEEAIARRAASRAALRTVLGRAEPPFGELSGTLRGSRDE
jgi:GT2 family glycosyltransferase